MWSVVFRRVVVGVSDGNIRSLLRDGAFESVRLVQRIVPGRQPNTRSTVGFKMTLKMTPFHFHLPEEINVTNHVA